MTETEYLNKLENLSKDTETYNRISKVFCEIYPKLSKWSYSEIEWLSEHIKRTSAKESFCNAQLWQGKQPII